MLCRSARPILVLTFIIERGRKLPSTRPEIVVVLESINPLHSIPIIYERRKILFLQNINLASVAAVYRGGQVLERLDEAVI